MPAREACILSKEAIDTRLGTKSGLVDKAIELVNNAIDFAAKEGRYDILIYQSEMPELFADKDVSFVVESLLKLANYRIARAHSLDTVIHPYEDHYHIWWLHMKNHKGD